MRKSRTIEVEKKKYSNLEKKEKHKFKMEEIYQPYQSVGL